MNAFFRRLLEQFCKRS